MGGITRVEGDLGILEACLAIWLETVGPGALGNWVLTPVRPGCGVAGWVKGKVAEE